MSAPNIPKALLDYLQSVFPDKLPETAQGPSSLETLIGEQRVIRHLQAQYRVQNKAGLPDVT